MPDWFGCNYNSTSEENLKTPFYDWFTRRTPSEDVFFAGENELKLLISQCLHQTIYNFEKRNENPYLEDNPSNLFIIASAHFSAIASLEMTSDIMRHFK